MSQDARESQQGAASEYPGNCRADTLPARFGIFSFGICTSRKNLAPLDLVIITITSLAAFFDLKYRKIPNWLILLGLGAGVVVNLHKGLWEFAVSISGFSLGIGILILPFLLGWIGAGDVKYLGVIGAMLGAGSVCRVLFYATLAAGMMAIGCVLTGRYKSGSIKNIWIDCKIAAMTFGRILPNTVRTRVSRGAYSIPWGVALSAGTITVYFLGRYGY